jgi:hypothetical protein
VYENGKMTPFESIPGMRGRGNKGELMEGVNSTMISCENLCKFHIAPQYNNNKKQK